MACAGEIRCYYLLLYYSRQLSSGLFNVIAEEVIFKNVIWGMVADFECYLSQMNVFIVLERLN